MKNSKNVMLKSLMDIILMAVAFLGIFKYIKFRIWFCKKFWDKIWAKRPKWVDITTLATEIIGGLIASFYLLGVLIGIYSDITD